MTLRDTRNKYDEYQIVSFTPFETLFVMAYIQLNIMPTTHSVSVVLLTY